MPEKIRVVVIDDHIVVRQGVRNLLERSPQIDVVAEGSVGDHVLELLEKHRPDVLITDLLMPAHEADPKGALFEPVSTLREAIRRFPDTAIMVLSQEDDIQTIQSLAEVGVRGYLLKTDEFAALLDKAVEMIHLGASYFSPEVKETILFAPRLKRNSQLTPRQLEALRNIIHNPEASRDQIAQMMGISVSTVQKHINAVFETLDVANMESCIIKALRMRLVDIDGVPSESLYGS